MESADLTLILMLAERPYLGHCESTTQQQQQNILYITREYIDAPNIHSASPNLKVIAYSFCYYKRKRK